MLHSKIGVAVLRCGKGWSWISGCFHATFVQEQHRTKIGEVEVRMQRILAHRLSKLSHSDTNSLTTILQISIYSDNIPLALSAVMRELCGEAKVIFKQRFAYANIRYLFYALRRLNIETESWIHIVFLTGNDSNNGFEVSKPRKLIRCYFKNQSCGRLENGREHTPLVLHCLPYS